MRDRARARWAVVGFLLLLIAARWLGPAFPLNGRWRTTYDVSDIITDHVHFPAPECGTPEPEPPCKECLAGRPPRPDALDMDKLQELIETRIGEAAEPYVVEAGDHGQLMVEARLDVHFKVVTLLRALGW